MKALSVLNAGGKTPVHALTKKERSSISEAIVDAVKDGKLSALEAVQAIKAMEKVLDDVYENQEFRDALLSEAASYERSFVLNGNTLEKAEAGVKYDFSQCNDPEYRQLLDQFNEAKKKKEDREKFLRAIPLKGFEVVDTDTGEAYTIYPPSRTSTSIVKVTLK